MRALVVKTTGNKYWVRSVDGTLVECVLKGKFRTHGIKSTNPIVVGDWVEVDSIQNDFVVVKLYERKNYILRKSVNLSKQTHIIAANIDQALLMITLKSPITTTVFIDRFLVAANAFGVEVVLLFNKTDLYNSEEMLMLKQLQSVYQKIGYRCFCLSTLTEQISDELKVLMKGKLNLLAGHSGVGKSTLMNKLQSNLNLVTKNISDIHHQGKHTTTFSELYNLDFGASVIDTPGIKGFGLVEIESNELANFFPEFFSIKTGCRFYNCTHTSEPSCAVKDAIANGDIAESRYQSYLNMLANQEDNFRIKGC